MGRVKIWKEQPVIGRQRLRNVAYRGTATGFLRF